MIYEIHPTSHFGPSAGAVGGSRVPAFPGFTGQTALMQTASSHDQISDLYRRRGSGYTHHVSNSSWMTTSASIAASGPTMASSTSTSGTGRGPAAAHSQQPPPPRAVSSRSLSSYSSVSTTGRNQPTTVVASNHPRQTSSSSTASSEVGQMKPRGLMAPPPGKDFSKPLFVDCSIEYELPNAPKIPKNSLPILMIHPGYQQKKRQQIQQQQLQQQQQQQQKQQQQQLLMNIKNKDTNTSKQTGCTAPNCHCRKIQVMKPGTKRSYSNALGSNASTTTTQAQFYKQQQQQQQQQLLQQQQKNRPG